MKIALTPHNYYPHAAAGGETYIHRLCKGLKTFGHHIKIFAHVPEQIEYDGFEIYPQGEPNNFWSGNDQLFADCDVIFHQLLGNPLGYNKSMQFKKPNVFFAHNLGKHYFLTNKSKVVYNSHSMGSLFDAPSTVLQPLIDYRDFSRCYGHKIALINCNENKGIWQFIELAKLLPQYEFVGYKGMYGAQITPNVPNIEWRDNGEIDWSEIKILLVPSETESWSQVATEAACCGITVICSPLPGLQENLSYAGIYIDRNNVNSYKNEIEQLMTDNDLWYAQSDLCYQRALDLDPMPRLEEFNQWLCKI